MLILLFSILLITFVLTTWGDMSLRLVSHLGKLKGESYNFLDRYLIGIASILVPLQLWSLFMPSGAVFLALSMSISVTYCFTQRKRIGEFILRTIQGVKTLSLWWKILIPLCMLLFIASSAWIDYSYDPEFYHYQSVLWAEHFAAIPGLANLEDRFGFNSNYILLSAIFSFNHHLLEQPIWALNLSLFFLLYIWIVVKTIQSRFDIKYIVLLATFFMYIFLIWRPTASTSTDLINDLTTIYLLSSILLNSEGSKKKPILFFVLPAFLLTFKLSAAPFVLFCFWSLWQYYNPTINKAALATLFTWGLLLVGLWLVRNVIISGYLVYPVYQIDLFSFDWKVPQEIAIMQNKYIELMPWRIWDLNKRRLEELRFVTDIGNLKFYLSIILFIISLISFIIFFSKRVKKKDKHQPLESILIVCSILILLLAASKGFDIRFIMGSTLVMFMYFCLSLFKNKKKYKTLGALFLSSFLIINIGLASRTIYYCQKIVSNGEIKTSYVRPALSALIKPYPYHEFRRAIKGQNLQESIYSSDFENQTIYTTNEVYSYYKFPTFITFDESPTRFSNYECVRMRGNSFKEGFITDLECYNKSAEKKYGDHYREFWLKK